MRLPWTCYRRHHPFLQMPLPAEPAVARYEQVIEVKKEELSGFSSE